MRRALLAIPLLLASPACSSRAPRSQPDRNAPCATLDARACKRARALLAVAPTYADERHDFLLTNGTAIPAGAGLHRSAEGWRRSGATCARASIDDDAKTRAGRFDLAAVPYAFVGLAVDSALVSADADLAPLLGAFGPPTHQIRLVAVAFARDLAPPAFRATPSLVASSRGDSC